MWVKNRITWLVCGLSILFSASAAATILEQVALDFGVPGDPFAGVLTPGQSGRAFLTLRNSGMATIENVTLKAIPGDCVTKVSESFFVERLAPGAVIRFDAPLELTLSPQCKRNDNAEILLLGSHSNEVGREERIWAQISFIVDPEPLADFLQEQINLFIPDEATVEYAMDINSLLTIKSVYVEIGVAHSYAADLGVVLIHPDGQEVTLSSSLWDLNNRFTSDSTSANSIYVPDLRLLFGKPSNGRWKLRIVDQASGDDGHLDFVRLTLRPK